MSDDVTVVHDPQWVQEQALAIVAAPGVPLHLCPSTLGRDREGIKRRFNAMGQSSLELGRDGTLLMEVADVLAYWVEDREDEEGQLHSYSWLVLIGTSGETWGTSSGVVATKVGQMVALWSAGLIERPTMVQVVTRKSRNSANHYHDVIMV